MSGARGQLVIGEIGRRPDRHAADARNRARYYGDGREWQTPPEIFEPLHVERPDIEKYERLNYEIARVATQLGEADTLEATMNVVNVCRYARQVETERDRLRELLAMDDETLLTIGGLVAERDSLRTELAEARGHIEAALDHMDCTCDLDVVLYQQTHLGCDASAARDWLRSHPAPEEADR